jgi:hypothetical protein
MSSRRRELSRWRQGRYLLPGVPIYLLLGLWVSRRPWLDQLIIGGGMALQAMLVVFFLNGGSLI